MDSMTKKLGPIWEKIAYYKAHEGEIDDIIADGNEKAKKSAEMTMERVRKSLNLLF
jgi:hypothetical protein